MKNMWKLELGQSSQLSTTLRIHIFALILCNAVTNPTKSPFLYPTIAKGVYLYKYACRKVSLSHTCWQHQCSSQHVQPNGLPLLVTLETLQYFSFCKQLTTRNVMHFCVPVSLHLTLMTRLANVEINLPHPFPPPPFFFLQNPDLTT